MPRSSGSGFFHAQGSNASDAAGRAWAGQMLRQQIDLLAYIDLFRTLAIIGALMAPIALSLRTIDLNAPARGIDLGGNGSAGSRGER